MGIFTLQDLNLPSGILCEGFETIWSPRATIIKSCRIGFSQEAEGGEGEKEEEEGEGGGEGGGGGAFAAADESTRLHEYSDS